MIKLVLAKLRKAIESNMKNLLSITKGGLLFLIIGSVWWGFLYLTVEKLIGTTPSLIMVWGSAAVFILALFPSIFNRIKRLKLKDFEIELTESLEDLKSKDFISVNEINQDQLLFSQKGDFENLKKTLKRISLNPQKPVILVVNTKSNHSIFIPALFIYLFFIEILTLDFVVLFISKKEEIAGINDIDEESVIGVVSGPRVVKELQMQFSGLYNIYNPSFFPSNGTLSNFRFDYHFGKRVFDSNELGHLFEYCLENLNTIEIEQHLFLTSSDVRNWFRDFLSKNTLEISTELNYRTIKNSLSNSDEHILLVEKGFVKNVIRMCSISNTMTKKALKAIK